MRKLKLFIGDVTVKLIRFLAKKVKINLLPIAYQENGITKSYNYVASGELYFINRFLHTIIKTDTPVFYDVGGNKGDYTLMLKESFPNSIITTFEPNPNTFQLLQTNIGDNSKLINKGVGENKGELELFFDVNNTTSVQASSNPEILKQIAKTTNLTSVKIDVITLDDYVKEPQIDLLKIDVEGFELEVLKGAKKLIENNKIKIIQFEFNEVNIIQRRFLKDFYDFLPNYSFYRLDEKRLIPLNEWQPKHEIFMFQNIIAILN
jgi:FkbM family methyltransferase